MIIFGNNQLCYDDLSTGCNLIVTGTELLRW